MSCSLNVPEILSEYQEVLCLFDTFGVWQMAVGGGSSERRVTNCAKLRPMPDEGLTGSLEGLKELNRCKVDLAEDLPDQWTGEVSPGVEGDCGRASVWVPVEDVTSSLSDPFEPERNENTLHRLRVDDGQAVHSGTSTSWSPTNRGRVSTEPS